MVPVLSRYSTTFSPRISTPTGFSFTCSDIPASVICQLVTRRSMHHPSLFMHSQDGSPHQTGTLGCHERAALIVYVVNSSESTQVVRCLVLLRKVQCWRWQTASEAWEGSSNTHLLNTRSSAGTPCGQPAHVCDDQSLRSGGPFARAAAPGAPASLPECFPALRSLHATHPFTQNNWCAQGPRDTTASQSW